MAKENVSLDDLKAKFTNLNQGLGQVNANVSKVQQALAQEQLKAQQVVGAMQLTADLMASIVGKEEAQKIVNSIQNPQPEVKKDGSTDGSAASDSD